MSMLGAGGSQTTLSQVLMPESNFDVEKAMSPSLYAKRMAKMSPQERQYAELIEQLKSRG
jgi:hypothetical protein